MSINWTQKSWGNFKVNGKMERRPWRWEGNRSDGRTFRILFLPHLKDAPYVCSSFNGTKIGAGRTLAQAQMLAEAAPTVKVNIAKAA